MDCVLVSLNIDDDDDSNLEFFQKFTYGYVCLQVTYQTSSTDYQTVWSITGGNQSGWQWLQLALPVGVRIILIDGDVGQSGVDSVGYMALDDLGILNTSCPPVREYKSINYYYK